jgi:hypothetical protein
LCLSGENTCGEDDRSGRHEVSKCYAVRLFFFFFFLAFSIFLIVRY